MYFLPRIVEIECSADVLYPDIENIGWSIEQTRPETWTPGQRSALADVVHILVNTAVEQAEGYAINELIYVIIEMKLNLAPFLSQIQQSPVATLSYSWVSEISIN